MKQSGVKWRWGAAKSATLPQVYIQPLLPSLSSLWDSGNKISRKYLFLFLDFKLWICLIQFSSQYGKQQIKYMQPRFLFSVIQVIQKLLHSPYKNARLVMIKKLKIKLSFIFILKLSFNIHFMFLSQNQLLVSVLCKCLQVILYVYMPLHV